VRLLSKSISVGALRLYIVFRFVARTSPVSDDPTYAGNSFHSRSGMGRCYVHRHAYFSVKKTRSSAIAEKKRHAFGSESVSGSDRDSGPNQDSEADSNPDPSSDLRSKCTYITRIMRGAKNIDHSSNRAPLHSCP